jgi:hypothetical protein
MVRDGMARSAVQRRLDEDCSRDGIALHHDLTRTLMMPQRFISRAHISIVQPNWTA